jgi:DNA-binding beta-propeller fold protein YncE
MRCSSSILLLAAVVPFMAAGCGDDKPTEPRGPYSLITTYAGTGVAALGGEGLSPDKTDLYWPQDVTFGPDGTAYIVDWQNHRIRAVKDGVTRTIIGNGEVGDALDGPATEASLNHPTHVSVDPDGNLIMSAWHNSKVVHYDMATKMIKTICGDGSRAYGGDGGPMEDALVDLPVCTVWDTQGMMYLMDQANQRIRIVENGIITTFAGTGVEGYAGDGGLAKDAQFSLLFGQAANPAGKLCIDRDNTIYIADTGNHIVRKILADEAPAPGLRPSHETNVIQLVAGAPETYGSTGEGVPATQALLWRPMDVAVGPDGDVFIADTNNHCVRRVDTNGIITTFAGQLGRAGYGGDGGPPTAALLRWPSGLEFDADGNLYIADRVNNRIRKVWRNP